MGAFRMNLAQKIVCVRRVVKDIQKLHPEILNPSYLYFLICVEHLNALKVSSNYRGVYYWMSANGRATNWGRVLTIGHQLTEHKLIENYNNTYYISIAGKALIKEFDKLLRKAHLKYKIKDDGYKTLPGPKRGKPMPNRHPKK